MCVCVCVCVCVSQDYMDQGQTKGFLYNVKHMFDLRDVVQDMGHVSVTHTHTHTHTWPCELVHPMADDSRSNGPWHSRDDVPV